jgi:hypothetical protein
MSQPELTEEKNLLAIVDKNIENPLVRKELDDHAQMAAHQLGSLIYSSNENVRLAAAKDILDRSGYKPIERKEVKMDVEIQKALPTEEEFEKLVNGYAKRSKRRQNVIDAEVV